MLRAHSPPPHCPPPELVLPWPLCQTPCALPPILSPQVQGPSGSQYLLPLDTGSTSIFITWDNKLGLLADSSSLDIVSHEAASGPARNSEGLLTVKASAGATTSALHSSTDWLWLHLPTCSSEAASACHSRPQGVRVGEGFWNPSMHRCGRTVLNASTSKVWAPPRAPAVTPGCQPPAPPRFKRRSRAAHVSAAKALGALVHLGPSLNSVDDPP